MEHAVDTPAPTAADPARVVVAPDAAPVPDTRESVAPSKQRKRQLPEWWHRDHPVFVPLAGFFTGMAYIILIPGTYAAILKGLVGYERAEELFPFVLLTLVVPIGLIVPQRTRKFGRYMLFGVLATAVVVTGVALLVLYILVTRDGLDLTR
jgi:hypothetical protein